MKAIYVLILAAAVVAMAADANMDEKQTTREIGQPEVAATPVPLVALLANPGSFVGKKIRVAGVYFRDSGGAYLFLSHEHCDAFDAASSIRMPVRVSGGQPIPETFERRFVLIEGEFAFDPDLRTGYMRSLSRVMLRDKRAP